MSVAIAVSLDGTVRSDLGEETFVMLTVDPGQHDLVADPMPPYRYAPTGWLTIPPERRRPASVAIHASPNERYFLELKCETGTGTTKTTLKERPQATAVEAVRDFRSSGERFRGSVSGRRGEAFATVERLLASTSELDVSIQRLHSTR